MTLSFAFSGLNSEPGPRRCSSCRTVAHRDLQPNTKLPGYWISRSELLGFRGCTFTGIERLPLHHSNRKKDGKTCAGSGMQCRSFSRLGKRMVEQNFANAAMTIKTWNSSKMCFESIFAFYSHGSLIEKLSRGERCERSPTRNRTLFG